MGNTIANNVYDNTAALQILGCAMKKPELVADNAQYEFADRDFVTDIHRVCFGAIYNLAQMGATEVTVETISDYLSDRPKSNGIFLAHKGEEFLKKVAQSADIRSFPYYYGRLKKFSLLRGYVEQGVDISEYYDVNNIIDTEKAQKQEDFLDETSLGELADIIEGSILSVRHEYVDNATEESHKIGEGLETLIDRLQIEPEFGSPLYGDLVNSATMGARLGKYYLRSAPTGIGKAIPNNTTIPTPTGDRKVGDIRPGDLLFGRNGQPTKVLQIHPQKEKKEIYKVYFEDGRIAECCKDHLWEVYYSDNGYMNHDSLDTNTLLEMANNSSTGFKSNGKCVWSVPVCSAVRYSKECEEKELLTSAYDMGLLVGSPYTPSIGVSEEYFQTTPQNRFKLLLGICRVIRFQQDYTVLHYKSVNHTIKDIVLKLSYGLGFKTQINKVANGWDITVDTKASEENSFNGIVKIEKTDEKVDMTCFTVDAEDHLFLMNDYIVTHNTRSMLADSCMIACDEIWDEYSQEWKTIGINQPTLFISTELEMDECQTMAIAFLANVNESKILKNELDFDEVGRVQHAMEVLSRSPLYIEIVPDFNIKSIENIIKRNLRNNKTQYVFFDYINSSLGLLQEIGQKTRGVAMREDNILFLLSTRLKELAVQLNIFIMSATQCNASWKTDNLPDANLLKGSMVV